MTILFQNIVFKRQIKLNIEFLGFDNYSGNNMASSKEKSHFAHNKIRHFVLHLKFCVWVTRLCVFQETFYWKMGDNQVHIRIFERVLLESYFHTSRVVNFPCFHSKRVFFQADVPSGDANSDYIKLKVVGNVSGLNFRRIVCTKAWVTFLMRRVEHIQHHVRFLHLTMHWLHRLV